MTTKKYSPWTKMSPSVYLGWCDCIMLTSAFALSFTICNDRVYLTVRARNSPFKRPRTVCTNKRDDFLVVFTALMLRLRFLCLLRAKNLGVGAKETGWFALVRLNFSPSFSEASLKSSMLKGKSTTPLLLILTSGGIPSLSCRNSNTFSHSVVVKPCERNRLI